MARAKPRHMEELREIPELRSWQIELLGPAFVKALRDVPNGAPSEVSAAKGKGKGSDDTPADDEASPYRDG